MFRSILVPIDGSTFSEHALPYALSLAAKTQAVVHIVLVHDAENYADRPELEPRSLDLEHEVRKREHDYLADLKIRLKSVTQVNFEIHHRKGAVVETLEEDVVERQVGLIVMSTHGRGYITRAILGGVTDRLVRDLSIPILLIHPSQAPVDLRVQPTFRDILIPLNGSQLAERIFEHVVAVTNPNETHLHLVRVVIPPVHVIGPFTQRTTDLDRQVVDSRTKEAAAYLEKVAEQLRGSSFTVETGVVVDGHPAAAVVNEVRKCGCDLIALTTRCHSGITRLLVGSVADKILRSASCPVLVYHPS